MKHFEIIILGAGASGLFFASQLKKRKIAIIDANNTLGKKILASGGGKCNLTNKKVSEENYLGDKKFIKEVLSHFSNQELLEYFQTKGVAFEKRDHGQLFCKKSARDITETLENQCSHCTFFYNQTIKSVNKQANEFIVTTEKEKFSAQKLVVATGGESYKTIGASTIGYEIAKSFGHTVVKTSPALVGFTVQPDEFWFKNLSGISFKAKVTVGEKEFIRDILFTHKGVSGPLILNASVYRNKGSIELDFLPNFDFKQIEKNNKFISTTIPLPKRFLKEFLEAKGVKDASFRDLSSEDRETIKTLKSYKFAPAGDFGYSKAEVTKGGVDTQEIDPKNLESKKVQNLFFIGEVLDVTGELGGFNFQWAFSSAFCCSKFLK